MKPVLWFALLAGASGCVDKAKFVQGRDLTTMVFHPLGPTEGVFPDMSVLDDPANPFTQISGYATDAVNNKSALQFQINNSTAQVAKFYIWATILAQAQPEGNGEAQYYAAVGLQSVFYFAKAPVADLPLVHDMAVAAFSVVLTQFEKTAITHDASGKIAYELLTPSLQAIIDLGAMPPTGWVMVKDANGTPRAVKQ